MTPDLGSRAPRDGARMGRSADATRKLYGRAMAAMAGKLRDTKDTA